MLELHLRRRRACVYSGQDVRLNGLRLSIAELGGRATRGGEDEVGGAKPTSAEEEQLVCRRCCGVVGERTKFVVRSRSARVHIGLQLSREMWEFAPDGRLCVQ